MKQIVQMSFLFVAYRLDYRHRETTLLANFIHNPSPQRKNLGIGPTQQTRGVGPMLGLCWASVVDDGPTLGQRLVFAG